MIGAHRSAVIQIDEDLEPPADDLVALAILNIRHEAHAARIVLAARIVQTLSRRGSLSTHRRFTTFWTDPGEMQSER